VDGEYVTFDPPGSIYTAVYGISDSDQTVGYYIDAAGTRHGFRLDLAGSGGTVTLDAPGAILTTATGLELYPVAYENRPEGRTKIYTLYAFDFEEIVLRAKVYREQAVAACRQGELDIKDKASPAR